MTTPILHPLVAAALAMSASARAEAIMTRPLPAVPDVHGFAGAFTGILGHQLLAGGGANFPDGVMPWKGGKKVWHDTLYALDLSTPAAQWRIIGHLPHANGYGVSLTTMEGVVIIGGGDASRHFQETLLLDLTESGKPRFAKLPDLPKGLAQMSGALVGRRIHLCGGIEQPDATRATDSHWTLDLDHPGNGWQKQPALPAAGRILASAAVVDGAFFIMGGCSLAPDASGKPVRTYLRDAWKFSAGQWVRIADLPRPLVAAASPAPVAGHALFLVSGDDGSQTGLANPEDHRGFSKDVLCYESATDKWSVAGELSVPPPVTVAVTPWHGEYLFFNGEVKPGVRTPQVFAFTPPGPNGTAHE